MQIEKQAIVQRVITGAPNLDPVTVIAEDIAPRQGKITISCYGESWTAYWGGMGALLVAEFFTSVSADYISGCLDRNMCASQYDSEKAGDQAKAHVFALRRKDDITEAEARELYDEISDTGFEDNQCGNSRLFERIYGEEWWHSLPKSPNPKYTYLIRIIEAVQAAFKQELEPA